MSRLRLQHHPRALLAIVPVNHQRSQRDGTLTVLAGSSETPWADSGHAQLEVLRPLRTRPVPTRAARMQLAAGGLFSYRAARASARTKPLADGLSPAAARRYALQYRRRLKSPNTRSSPSVPRRPSVSEPWRPPDRQGQVARGRRAGSRCGSSQSGRARLAQRVFASAPSPRKSRGPAVPPQ
jgi:hypothetical protein